MMTIHKNKEAIGRIVETNKDVVFTEEPEK